MHLSTPMLFVCAAIPMAACGFAVLFLRNVVRGPGEAPETVPLDAPETAV
jgi:hypothetical protein